MNKNTIIEEFILANPYPSFEEMEDLQSRRIDLDAEYGQHNHMYCKEIYETMHLDNRKLVEGWIQTIKSSGGSQALKCNVETMRLFSPIAKCTDVGVLQKFTDIYNYVMTQL
jgi:hypothetical protein